MRQDHIIRGASESEDQAFSQINSQVKRKALLENVASLYMLQGANYLLPIITIPYLMRVLGADKYGLIVMAFAISQYLIIVTDYGFNITAVHKIAVNKHDKKRISEIFGVVVAVKLMLLAASSLILVMVVLLFPTLRGEWSLFGVAFLAVIGSVLFPVWYFQGIENMKYITFLNVISKIFATIGIFALVKNQSDVMMAALLQALGPFFAGLTSVWLLIYRFSVRLVWPSSWSDVISELKEGWAVFTATLAGNLYGQGAVLIVGLIAGNVAAANYAVVQKVGAALSGLVQPVAQAIYPSLCMNAISDTNRVKRTLKRTISLIMLMGLVVGAGVFYGSEWIDNAVIGKQSDMFVALLHVYVFVIVLDQINVMLNPFIMAFKKFEAVQRMYIRASLLFLLVSIPSVYFYGAPAMAYTVLLVVEVFVLINSVFILKSSMR